MDPKVKAAIAAIPGDAWTGRGHLTLHLPEGGTVNGQLRLASSASRPIITPRLRAASLIQPIQDRHDVTASQPPSYEVRL